MNHLYIDGKKIPYEDVQIYLSASLDPAPPPPPVKKEQDKEVYNELGFGAVISATCPTMSFVNQAMQQVAFRPLSFTCMRCKEVHAAPYLHYVIFHGVEA